MKHTTVPLRTPGPQLWDTYLEAEPGQLLEEDSQGRQEYRIAKVERRQRKHTKEKERVKFARG